MKIIKGKFESRCFCKDCGISTDHHSSLRPCAECGCDGQYEEHIVRYVTYKHTFKTRFLKLLGRFKLPNNHWDFKHPKKVIAGPIKARIVLDKTNVELLELQQQLIDMLPADWYDIIIKNREVIVRRNESAPPR